MCRCRTWRSIRDLDVCVHVLYIAVHTDVVVDAGYHEHFGAVFCSFLPLEWVAGMHGAVSISVLSP